MTTAISIREIVKVFPAAGGSGISRAVDGISLDIQPGELFFLLGPSGCGKTTLLRMIAGFIEPTAGTVAFNGRDVTFLPPNKRNTGMVFQSYALWPHMTVEQNVAFGLTIRRVKGGEKARRVRDALGAVRMAEYASRRPTQLSGGQQQRVALARALVIRPDVLLLDEPLSNLDAKLRVELRSEIRRVCKEAAITTVYVTHDQKEALSMADRVAVLNQGRVVQLGGPRELYRRPESRFVAEFLGETNLFPGRVLGREGARVMVETGIGTLAATAAEGAGSGDVLCSVRPEAWRVRTGGSADNAVSGRIVEEVYLGELAQYVVSVKGQRIRVAQMNPDSAPDARGELTLTVSPDDVVAVPV